MKIGTVKVAKPDRNFALITPQDDPQTLLLIHMRRGPVSPCSEPVPTPARGDVIRYTTDGHNPGRAALWEYDDLRRHFFTLTNDQVALVKRVLGADEARRWQIWNGTKLLPERMRHPGREYCGAYRLPPGTRGTFNQVLLWARRHLGECGIDGPKLQYWDDMPRYSVRARTGSRWQFMGLPYYTGVQAEAAAAKLCTNRRYDEVCVLSIPRPASAPPLSAAEAAKVLATCGRDSLSDHSFGDTEVTWHDPDLLDLFGQPLSVAEGYFSPDEARVTLDGHTYTGAEARQLRDCGFVLQAALNA